MPIEIRAQIQEILDEFGAINVLDAIREWGVEDNKDSEVAYAAEYAISMLEGAGR